LAWAAVGVPAWAGYLYLYLYLYLYRHKWGRRQLVSEV